MPSCTDCRKQFRSRKALQQHYDDSPEHSYRCNDCERDFISEQALQQHLENSQVHARRYHCEDCDRSFGTEQALSNHLESPRHIRDTPMDNFFLSFSDFNYSPISPPSAEFERLRDFYGWKANSAESRDAWERYREALVQEFNTWYGMDNTSLASWQNLCKVLRIEPLPPSCKLCRKAVRGCYVNMVDLVSHKRGTLEAVKLFPDIQSLRAYTVRTRRYFPKDSLEAGALLKHLLREIFID